MKNKKLENSVKSLVTLYTVVMGVAMSLALARIIDAEKGIALLTLPTALIFIAFIATLFPFFHGALRHLDDAYIENPSRPAKTAVLIVDFILLFVHALAFVVLALLVRLPTQFAWALICLLAIDIIWGTFTHFVLKPGEASANSKWVVLNIVYVLTVGGFLIGNHVNPGSAVDPLKISTLLCTACLLRSFLDYFLCQSFYFPN